jgi:hypothetical protein
MSKNLGFDPAEIARFEKELEASGKPFQFIDDEEVSIDMAEFMFVGKYEGQPVIFDCLLGTLQLAYESNLMEMAEEKTKKKYPDYKGFDFEVDEKGNAISHVEESEEVEEYKAFAMFELEESGEAKVAESLTFDNNFDYGIGLEVYLNVSEISDEAIIQFIQNFNSGNLVLDPTRFAFEAEEDED